MRVNRFKVASSLLTAIVALCAFLLQPSSLTVFENPQMVGVVVGAVAVVAQVISTTLPSWSQSGAAERAMRRAEADTGPRV